MTQIGTVKQFTGAQVVARGAAGVLPSITITTNDVDREYDRMQVDALVVPEHLPVMFSHESRELPVGRTVRIERTPTSMVATFEWLKADERAARVRNAFEQNMLSASVGMRVTDSTPNRFGGLDLAGELLEWSLVAIPANPQCVRLLKSLGLASDAPRDDEIVVVVDDDGPDEQLERQIERERILGITPSAATLKARRLKEIEMMRKHVLRDGPTNNPNVPGKVDCPGPSGGSGCEWEHPQPVEACRARPHCPRAGQNVSAGIVIIDDDEPTYAVDPDVVAAALRRTLPGMVERVVVERARAWNMKLTGKID